MYTTPVYSIVYLALELCLTLNTNVELQSYIQSYILYILSAASRDESDFK
jgi:hypothetical protein